MPKGNLSHFEWKSVNGYMAMTALMKPFGCENPESMESVPPALSPLYDVSPGSLSRTLKTSQFWRTYWAMILESPLRLRICFYPKPPEDPLEPIPRNPRHLHTYPYLWTRG